MPVNLQQLPGEYTVCRLAPEAAFPVWADGEGFVSISRTDDELSVVCRSDRVPPQVLSSPRWTCLKLLGPFAFDEAGIALAVIRPLSENGIGVFLVSTYDGDHLLLQCADLEKSVGLLTSAGHKIETG